MKWMPLIALLCSCIGLSQARADSFSKCSGEGGTIAYRSQTCLTGETLVATLDPVPQARPSRAIADPPHAVHRNRPSAHTRRAGHQRRASSQTRPQQHPRKPRRPSNACAKARQARDDFQRRRGIHITMAQLSRWNHRVYDTCK